MSARRLFGVGVAAVGSLIVLTGLAGAAPGDLDQTFGTAGRVLVPLGSYGATSSASVVQPDGKVILVGTNLLEPPPPPPPAPPAPHRARLENEDFFTVRLNVDGSLDSSFGSGGIVRTPIDLDPGARDFARAVALGPDGSIVVVGEASRANYDSDLAFVRYTPSGALDTSFSGDGIQTLDFAPQDFGYSVAVQPSDGKIVAVGTESGQHPVFEVLRLNQDGSLDGSFGSGGVVHTSIGSPSAGDYSDDVVLDGSRIVVAGTADSGNGSGDFALVRYLSDGQLDQSFGSGGVVVTPGPEDELIWASAVLAGGKILVAGYGGSYSTTWQFMLARYLVTGALDPTFGGTGVVTTQIGNYSGAVSLAVQADGKAVAGGFSTLNGPGFGLARYNVDGSLDASFGDAGKRRYPVGTYGGDGTSVGIQRLDGDPSHERLVQGGTAWEPAGGNFAAIAIQLHGPPAQPPPSPPIRCRVPRVVHQRLAAARTKIRRAHCSVGRIRSVRARRFRGIVVAQSPRAGKQRARGTRINLVVGRR